MEIYNIIKKTVKHNRINTEIIAESVRVIGVNGEQIGVLSLQDALNLSKNSGFDLVEIQPNVIPPVVKVMDYGKYVFKQEKVSKKNQLGSYKTKEVKFRPCTDTNDYNLKIRHLSNFLKNGSKVKVTIWFRGREILYKDFGFDLISKICFDVSEFGRYELPPKSEGKIIVVLLVPSLKKL